MHAIKTAAIAMFWLMVANSVTTVAGTPLDKLSEILKTGKLIIATEPEYPPMAELLKGANRRADSQCLSNEYTADEFAGFEIEIAKAVAKRLGVEPCFVTPAWNEVISGKWADRWDITFNSISITLERMESLYFAQPYLSEPSVFYVHQFNTTFRQPADLSGKKIGVCTGCTFESYLEETLMLPGQELACVIKNPAIIAYDPEAKGLSDLSIGDGVKIDAVLTSLYTGDKAISDGLHIKQLGEPVFYTYIAPAIDKKQIRNTIPFIKKINELIIQLQNDGTMSILAEKHLKFSADVIKPAKNFNIESLKQY